MKRCKHLACTIVASKDRLSGLWVERRQCERCGAWLSLGPSDETDPRVAVEIRAAELAVASDGNYLAFRDIATPPEFWGWHMHMYSYDDDEIDADGEHAAGYLARAIAAHDTEES